MRNHDKNSNENHLSWRTGAERVRIDLVTGISASFVCLLCLIVTATSHYDSTKIVPNTIPNGIIGMAPINSTGTNDPMQDPVNTGNAQVGGGPNLPTDGTGPYNPVEPVRSDYPEEPTVAALQVHESSGMGAGHHDQTITGPGNVDNGNPAPRDPIPVNYLTTMTNANTKAVTYTRDEVVTGYLTLSEVEALAAASK